MVKFIDVSVCLKHDTVIYPGDNAVRIDKLKSIAHGDGFCLNAFYFTNHTATHIDFPAHMIENGKTSDSFSLDYLIGTGLVIDVPEEYKSIPPEIIEQHSILAGDIILFKTSNSLLHASKKFHSDYVYLEPKTADALVKKKVKIVGIDYLSPDRFGADFFPVHHILLANNILIIENLNLISVPSGRYKIYVIPIKVDALDGMVARVFLEREHECSE